MEHISSSIVCIFETYFFTAEQAENVVIMSLRSEEKQDLGIQSLQTGAEILRCFAQAAKPLTLSAVSVATGIAPGKVHRYLRGFVSAGLIIQESSTRRYDLGPLCFSLGVAALRRHDIVREASNRLADLSSATGESASLLVWGDGGPVVIRSEESRQYVAVILRVGGTVKLTTSSAGYLFAAFLPDVRTQAMIAAELASMPTVNGKTVTARSFARKLIEVRRRGVADIYNGPVPGTFALSAPLFEADGRIVGAVSVVGRSARVSESDGHVERELGAFVSRVQDARA